MNTGLSVIKQTARRELVFFFFFPSRDCLVRTDQEVGFAEGEGSEWERELALSFSTKEKSAVWYGRVRVNVKWLVVKYDEKLGKRRGHNTHTKET